MLTRLLLFSQVLHVIHATNCNESSACHSRTNCSLILIFSFRPLDPDFNYFNGYGDREAVREQQEQNVGGHYCANLNTGEDDIPVVDLISKLKLDDFSYEFPGVKKVRGSNRIQTAYRLSRRADLSAPTKSLLPYGLPQQFSFVCSFRKRPSKNDTWSLLRVQDPAGQPQFDLTLHPQKQSLELIAMGHDSRSRTLVFPDVDCDDGQWYKLHLGIFVDRVSLYLNCEKHSTLPIDFGNDINLNGNVQVAKYSDASNMETVPVSRLCAVAGRCALFQFHLVRLNLLLRLLSLTKDRSPVDGSGMRCGAT